MNSQTIICSNCKTPNPARNLYCQSCGRPLIPAGPSVPAGDATMPVQAQPGGHGITPPPAQNYPPPASVYPPPPAQSAFVPPPVQPVSDGSPYPQPADPTANTMQVQPPAQQLNNYPPPQNVPPAYPYQQPVYQAAPAGPSFFEKTQARADALVSDLKKEAFSAHADSWADLVSGAGEKAAEVEQNFVEDFNSRGLTYVDLGRVETTSGLNQRTYQVAHHRSGSVAVYANQAGKDLMLGWDLNIIRKPSWSRILILVLVMLGVSFLTNLIVGWDFGRFLTHWIFDILNWALPVSILALLAGQIIKGDIWYMFIEKPDEAALQELAALANAAHQSLQTAVKKTGLNDVTLRAKKTFNVG